MLDDFFDAFRDYRQDSQIRRLKRRLDTFAAARSQTHTERNLAAAVVRLLLEKGLITADELADEMEAINEEQYGKINETVRRPGESLNEAEIAKLDQAAPDPASEIRLDLE